MILRPVSAGTATAPPPAYWVYGARDPLVDATAQGLVIAQQWADAGGESWIDVVDDGDHNLDETVANGYSARGYIRALIGLDIDQAEADFARAEELAPNAPNGPSWSARILAGTASTS